MTGGNHMTKWSRHLYQPNLPLGQAGEKVTGSREHIALARRGATEGMVLLKNENKTLPIADGTKIALFGKASIDYVKGGGGSGDVTVAYTTSIVDGMLEKEKEGKVNLYHELIGFYQDNVAMQRKAGYEPGMTKEPKVPAELLDKAAEFAKTAIITFCRFSGEGWDRKTTIANPDSLPEDQLIFAKKQLEVFPDGDFCLTAKERELVADVTAKFEQVIIVLNTGGMMETAWIKEDAKISAALLAWQGGMEGGRAMADILVGDAYPSGKLSDTFARNLEDYPSSDDFHESEDYAPYTDDIYVGYRYFETIPGASEKVIYPFGYGLTYTSFDIQLGQAVMNEKEICISAKVVNTGDYNGKEVVQLYYSAPKGLLGKPAKELGAFVKTKELKPGESQTVMLTLPVALMASYDDLGKIAKSAWVLEKGSYQLYVGNSVRNTTLLAQTYEVIEDTVVRQLSAKLVPSKLPARMLSDGSLEALPTKEYDKDPNCFARMTTKESEAVSPLERARDHYFLYEHDEKSLFDVAKGKVSLDDFIDQLPVEDLIWLLGGQKNLGVANTFGVGNLPQYDIPNIMTADGPAGLRIRPEVGVVTTAWPCATMLACSFNPALAQEIGCAVAKEVKENNIGIWLAPAVNIHRSPLCGRNFEYYSEDPYLAGKIGTGMVSGVQSQNIAATVKHFAFNNKETNRKLSDSRVSERAAREIYLKAFEIIVKEAGPWCIMTSYNLVNGIQCSENKELIQGILREEWGFDGLVMTDWWTSGEQYLEAKAGNDLKMANGYPKRTLDAYNKGEITLEEIKFCAKNVLNLILKME